MAQEQDIFRGEVTTVMGVLADIDVNIDLATGRRPPPDPAPGRG